MPIELSATETRVHFGKVLGDVKDTSEPVLIENNGDPVGVIIDHDLFQYLSESRTLEQYEEQWRRTREIVAKALNGRPFPDIDEMIDYGRDDVS